MKARVRRELGVRIQQQIFGELLKTTEEGYSYCSAHLRDSSGHRLLVYIVFGVFSFDAPLC